MHQPFETIIKIPKKLPFLEAICWQTQDVRHFTLSEMLERYESGWKYRGLLADLEGEELNFVRGLVNHFGSWIVNNV
jgi:hypothetical protein